MKTKQLNTIALTFLSIGLILNPAQAGTLLYSENFDGEAASLNGGTTPEVNVGGETRDLQSSGTAQSTSGNAWITSNNGVGEDGLRFGPEGANYNWAAGANAAAILADGGFSVSYDWNENGGSATDWVALKVYDGAAKANENFAIINAAVDFSALFRVNGAEVQMFDNSVQTNTAISPAVSGTTHHVEYQFAFDSFNAGTNVDFTLRIDGNAEATHTFTWDATDDVRIFLTGEYGGALIDNVEVSTLTIPEPSTAILVALGLIGLVGLRRRR